MIVGITGSIGSGKSTMLKLLRTKYGFATVEADDIIVSAFQDPSSYVYQHVINHVGDQVIKDGAIDRDLLRPCLTPELRAAVDAVIIPHIWDQVLLEVLSSEKGGHVFFGAAQLASFPVHRTVEVKMSNLSEQIERAVQRGTDRAAVMAILARQAHRDVPVDFQIVNDNPVDFERSIHSFVVDWIPLQKQ